MHRALDDRPRTKYFLLHLSHSSFFNRKTMGERKRKDKKSRRFFDSFTFEDVGGRVNERANERAGDYWLVPRMANNERMNGIDEIVLQLQLPLDRPTHFLDVVLVLFTVDYARGFAILWQRKRQFPLLVLSRVLHRWLQCCIHGSRFTGIFLIPGWNISSRRRRTSIEKAWHVIGR